MAELKTSKTRASVSAFLNGIEDKKRRAECKAVAKMMREATGCKPEMWGPAMVGYGSYHFKYASGREGDWFIAGFSPRKTALTVYIMPGFAMYDKLMAKLGKHKTGKSCLYLSSLDDVDKDVLRELIEQSVRYMKKKYD
ncbi:MAG: DUF1801 domain-containing protein [Woeseia sp.]